MTSRAASPAGIAQVAAAFGFSGPLEVAPHGSGHIHDTFLARFQSGPGDGAVILQRINERVFPDVRLLMDNITRVCAHLEAKHGEDPDSARRALSLLRERRSGRSWLRDEDGRAWRAYRFIARAVSFDALVDAGQARRAAFAFARFQRDLFDLPPPRLEEILPGFHHTPGRFATFSEAAAAAAPALADSAADAIAFAVLHESLARALHDPWQGGLLCERVTHNDTKLNNVLFDRDSGEALCVIDLDTVMPGLALWDFGDLCRSTLLPQEDERELGRIAASTETFGALAAGYGAGLGGSLVPSERERLVIAAQVMTFECGLRFLTDHLRGDVYFKIHRPGQNLDRARAHFALVRSLIDRRETLEAAAAEGLRAARIA